MYVVRVDYEGTLDRVGGRVEVGGEEGPEVGRTWELLPPPISKVQNPGLRVEVELSTILPVASEDELLVLGKEDGTVVSEVVGRGRGAGFW